MVSAGRIREGLAGRLRVACGSLAGPCGSLPGAGKDLPARTGERRREETGKADREAHLVNGKAGRRPGSPDPSAELELRHGLFLRKPNLYSEFFFRVTFLRNIRGLKGGPLGYSVSRFVVRVFRHAHLADA